MCSVITCSPSVPPAAVTTMLALSLSQLLRTLPMRWQMKVSDYD